MIAVVIGFAIAFPLALLAHRFRRLEQPFGALSALVYTIPSLALFQLLDSAHGHHADDGGDRARRLHARDPLPEHRRRAAQRARRRDRGGARGMGLDAHADPAARRAAARACRRSSRDSGSPSCRRSRSRRSPASTSRARGSATRSSVALARSDAVQDGDLRGGPARGRARARCRPALRRASSLHRPLDEGDAR